MIRRRKILNVFLILTSLFGYLEWGGGQHAFLFEAEMEVLSRLARDPKSALHPFTVFPMLAQILLLITLFQQQPQKSLTYTGIAGLSLLLGFMCFIGVLGSNVKIILSTLPFSVTAIITIAHYRMQSKTPLVESGIDQ